MITENEKESIIQKWSDYGLLQYLDNEHATKAALFFQDLVNIDNVKMPSSKTSSFNIRVYPLAYRVIAAVDINYNPTTDEIIKYHDELMPIEVAKVVATLTEEMNVDVEALALSNVADIIIEEINNKTKSNKKQ